MKDLLLRARVVVRTSNMKISRRHLADYVRRQIAPKGVPHVQHDYFTSFNQSNSWLWRCLCRCRRHVLNFLILLCRWCAARATQLSWIAFVIDFFITFLWRYFVFLNSLLFSEIPFLNSSTAFADAHQHEEDHEEGNIYFRTFKKLSKFAFRRRKQGGKKQDLGKNSFQLELGYLRQKDGSGMDTGESINTFANQTFSVSSFNKAAEFQGKLQDLFIILGDRCRKRKSMDLF